LISSAGLLWELESPGFAKFWERDIY